MVSNKEVDMKAAVKPQLKPYQSPVPTMPIRGEYYGIPPSVLDVRLLGSMIALVSKVERATVTPHPSVLHRTYSELMKLLDEGPMCGEMLWARDMLSAAESLPSRRRVAGAPSTVQFRGTGDFWSHLHKQLRRRVAEKALCKVRSLYEIPSATRRAEYLAELAECIALDPELRLGFATNGYDLVAGAFVREPDVARAERLLCAAGAPLGAVPMPVPRRVRGVRLAQDGQGPNQ